MQDDRSFLDKLLRRNIGYSSPVYDPSYVYAPWKKWVLLAVIAVFVGLVMWFAATNSNKGGLGGVQNSGGAAALIPVSEASDTPQPATVLYPVEKVVDGDTIDVTIKGKTERIRLIGMDTPETVDPRTVVQCFGKEASDKSKATLAGVSVRLEQDATQGERDKYGRILAYVFLQDGTNFNKYMISEGYAHEYTYNVPYKYQQEFKAAQASASSADRGLWSPSTCNGDTSSAAPAPAAAAPKATAPAANASNCDPNYTPCIPNVSYDLDCADVGKQVRVIGTDTHRLDREGDGYGCESY